MTLPTILWILGAAILALGFALFQYYYKVKYTSSRNAIYAILRFLTVFLVLILLINPTYKKVSYYIEKPSLAVAIDNSESVAFLKYDDRVSDALVRFRESETLNEAFDIQYYSFGNEIQVLDSLNFNEKQTDISNVFERFSSIYKNDIAPSVLISDGNQTLGTAFQYSIRNYKNPVYSIAVGDTIVYDDLKLGQLNVNRYAYINNKFPVELFTNYTGSGDVQSNLIVRTNGRTVYKETLTFSASIPSRVVNFLLPAESVGVRQYEVLLEPISNEKNIKNNAKNFAIEVIDQKTNVAIVSTLRHPDIGTLRKSIEKNRLRAVTILTPQESLGKLDEYDVAILYQPNQDFDKVFDELNDLDKNRIIITGTKTNWRFLNTMQNTVQQEITGQVEEVQGTLNISFSTFGIDGVNFEDYPPLKTAFGDLNISGSHDIALFQKIGTIETESPLLITTEENSNRTVWLFGEGVWRWRAQNYIDKRDFETFDKFVDNLIQYTASKRRKSRFNVDFESFYYGTDGVQITAQYFDKNYVFDNRAVINLKTTNQETQEVYNAPFLLKRNSYTVDLSNLEAGTYDFIASVEGQGLVRSGTFIIVPFEIEQQFLNANVNDLKTIASSTDGLFIPIDDVPNLIDVLINDNRYKPIEKSKENIVPLIDWKWLLGLLVLLLALEWFIRKYNGLI